MNVKNLIFEIEGYCPINDGAHCFSIGILDHGVIFLLLTGDANSKITPTTCRSNNEFFPREEEIGDFFPITG